MKDRQVFKGYGMTHIKNDGPKMDYQITDVVWADGTRDMRDSGGGSERATCIICHNFGCNIPVHLEKYRVISSSIAKQWELDNPVI